MKSEEYGLLFLKRKLPYGDNLPSIQIAKSTVNANSLLSFIERLDEYDCSSLIYDLIRCIGSNSNVDEGFFTDTVEHMSILYKYPNVEIDDILIIPMFDLKKIVEEWLEFIK